MSNVFEEIPEVLGGFAELGGTIFYVDWSPEPRQVEGAFMWLAGYLENVEYPLVFSMMVAQEDTRQRFRDKKDPGGFDWPALDPDYEREKGNAGYDSPNILIRDGYLEEAAPYGWKIVGASLVYDTSNLPESPDGVKYGLLHQTGVGDPEDVGAAFNARETVRFRKASGEQQAMAEDRPGPVKESLGIGRGRALPARPWIGLSPEATEEIAMIFTKWFETGPEEMPWPEEPLVPGPIEGGGMAITTTGLIGEATPVHAYGGGFSVRGAGGRFIGVQR